MRIQSIGDYYTLQGAAEALGVSYWQVWRAVHQQQTPTLLLGQTRLVLLEDVQAALPERGDQREPVGQRLAAAQSPERPASPAASAYRVLGQLCPQCESRALVYEEGCQKCYACGYAVC
ncbi:MAG TPA: hypothetical protein VKT82_20990 [Ktedonobacterales bacterium]|nr:hypothetical protein [Ktedonobacterales bacterium]